MFLISMLAFVLNVQAYEIKSTKVSGYTQPWIMIKADGVTIDSIREIRLHLHGWSQNQTTGAPQNPLYDFSWKNPKVEPTLRDYQKFVESYGIHHEVENDPKRVVIVAVSRGHCDQYPELLKNFDATFSAVLNQFKIIETATRLTHVSAHSGGGEVLSGLLMGPESNYFSQVLRATFYDAIYSEGATKRLMSWLTSPLVQGSRRLELLVIKGGRPDQWTQKILASIGTPEVRSEKKVYGINFELRKKVAGMTNVVLSMSESGSVKSLDHWSVVKHLWDFD